MTAPVNAQAPSWKTSVYILIGERPAIGATPAGEEISIQSAFGQQAVVLKRKAPERARPKTPAPSLPGGVSITCEERVLVYDLADNGDRELSSIEQAACKEWLAWRWVPGWRPPVAR